MQCRCQEGSMDGFVRHQIECASVDIDVVPVTPRGYCARFRIFRDAADKPEWHQVHVSGSVFDTPEEAEEAARPLDRVDGAEDARQRSAVSAGLGNSSAR